MGREIKRVPLDFDWPLKEVWEGFLNPYSEFLSNCPACDGSGYNPQTKQIADDWYDFAGTGRRWCGSITQDEIEALIRDGRLWDFTNIWQDGKKLPKRWLFRRGIIQKAVFFAARLLRSIGVSFYLPNMPTAEVVNQWNGKSMGHDAINRYICVKARTRRLGVYGLCKSCKGNGELWFSDDAKFLYEHWEPTEPPSGDGWQVWETVSEGSPISPVFATSQELVEWLVGEGYSRKAARNFAESGWVPSAMVAGGKMYSDIECAAIDS